VTPTPQTLDPLGGLTARYFLITTVALAAGTAGVLVARHPHDISSPLIQGGALVVLAAAIVQAILAADPRWFPFSGTRHTLLQVTMLLAAALDVASRDPGPAIGSAWGPTCVALLYVMVGSFRPPREILVLAAISALVVAAILAARLGSLAPALAVSQLLRSIVPIAAVGAGAAAFSSVLIRRLLAWRAEQSSVPDSARTAAATDVQRDRLDFVDYRVGPYLEGLLASDVLTPVDAARARGLAASLRQQMLRDASRPWFVDVVDSIDGDAGALDVLTPEQRRALGTVIAEVRSAPGFVPGSLRARIPSEPPLAVTIEATVDRARLRTGAHRAVLGAVFARVRMDVEQSQVTIRLQVDR
jgi:hypothetical protein